MTATPAPQTTQPWIWNYSEAGDTWELTTPEYDPPVSFRARRLGLDKVIYSRHRKTTMPPEVAEVLARVVREGRIFELADSGARELILQPDEVLKSARNLRRLWGLWKASQRPKTHFMGQTT